MDATDAPSQATVNLYNNPYMLEEFADQSAMNLGFDGPDFPPGALSLMYSPPPCQEDDFSDEGVHLQEWPQDDFDLTNGVPKLMSLNSNPPVVPLPAMNLGAAIRSGGPVSTGGGAQRRHHSMDAAYGYGHEGGGGRGSHGPFREVSDSFALASATAFVADEGRPRALEGMNSGPRSLSVPRLPAERTHLIAPRYAAHSPDTPRLAAGDTMDVQPEVTSREMPVGECEPMTLYGDRPQNSLAQFGQITSAEILRCVQKAQAIPERQRPNTEKWTKRWGNFQPRGMGGHGLPLG